MTQLLPLRSGNSGPAFIAENNGDTLIWDAAAQRWTTGPGGGGGAVDSVFGRTGVVVAATGDYDGDQVDNVSGVPGASVSDALDYLEANAGAVASVFGRTGVVVAATNDYNATQVQNDSSVAGTGVKGALNTLLAAIAALTSTSIANVSGVTGSTVTAALNAVGAAITGLTSTSIANVSSVAGSTVTAALNALSLLTPTPIKTDPTPRNTTQTLVVANGNRVLITALASDITLTIGVTGAAASEGFLIERRDTSAFQVTVINGGPAGAGGPAGGPNLYVFPGSVARSSSFLFDAADWSQGINLAITP